MIYKTIAQKIIKNVFALNINYMTTHHLALNFNRIAALFRVFIMSVDKDIYYIFVWNAVPNQI